MGSIPVTLSNNDSAIIVLHEIYGINDFIRQQCNIYHTNGFDVYCPDMNKIAPFSYDQSAVAYEHFNTQASFNFYTQITALLIDLKMKYTKVFLAGFSIDATVAWRCCEAVSCDGIIGCYGSRIRDYLLLDPACPVLLLFAQHDSFDVNTVVTKLSKKANIKIISMNARHGFIDMFNKNTYHKECADEAARQISQFLNSLL